VQAARKANDNKSFRIGKEDLASHLFKHFEEHEYWSMKGFREVTNQPEAYLKEVLEEIAIMNKSGPYSGKWSLRPEFKQRSTTGVSNIASAGTDGGVNTGETIEIDDDDDDEVEMEDVLTMGSK